MQPLASSGVQHVPAPQFSMCSVSRRWLLQCPPPLVLSPRGQHTPRRMGAAAAPPPSAGVQSLSKNSAGELAADAWRGAGTAVPAEPVNGLGGGTAGGDDAGCASAQPCVLVPVPLPVPHRV